MNRRNIATPIPPLLIIACLLGIIAIPGNTTASVPASPDEKLASLQSLATLDRSPRYSPPLLRGWNMVNGPNVIFHPIPGVPLVDVHISIARGKSSNPVQTELDALTYHALLQSSTLKKIEDLGAEVSYSFAPGWATFSLRAPSAEPARTAAVELFVSLLSQPDFSDDAIRRAKIKTIDGIANQDTTTDLIISLLYPKYPDGLPLFGEPENIVTRSPGQIRTSHLNTYTGKNANIVITGDLSEAAAHAISNNFFYALPISTRERTPSIQTGPDPVRKAQSRHIEADTRQTRIILAQHLPAQNTLDHTAIEFARMILGHGLSSRLNVALRQQHASTYGVHTQITQTGAGEILTVDFSTSPEHREAAISRLQQLLKDYLLNGPTEQEIREMKQHLLNRVPLLNANRDWINGALIEIQNLARTPSLNSFEHVAQRLTHPQIRTALNEHFSPDGWLVLSIGPTVAQKPLSEPPVDQPPCLSNNGVSCQIAVTLRYALT